MYSAMQTLTPEAWISIAGHRGRGLVGWAPWRHFTAHGFENLIGRTSTELDLRDTEAIAAFFAEMRPGVVIGGRRTSGRNRSQRELARGVRLHNLKIQVNLFDGAMANGDERFLFRGLVASIPSSPSNRSVRTRCSLGRSGRRTRPMWWQSWRVSHRSPRSGDNIACPTSAQCRRICMDPVKTSVPGIATSCPHDSPIARGSAGWRQAGDVLGTGRPRVTSRTSTTSPERATSCRTATTTTDRLKCGHRRRHHNRRIGGSRCIGRRLPRRDHMEYLEAGRHTAQAPRHTAPRCLDASDGRQTPRSPRGFRHPMSGFSPIRATADVDSAQRHDGLAQRDGLGSQLSMPTRGWHG
jgi:hypothetical protein